MGNKVLVTPFFWCAAQCSEDVPTFTSLRCAKVPRGLIQGERGFSNLLDKAAANLPLFAVETVVRFW